MMNDLYVLDTWDRYREAETIKLVFGKSENSILQFYENSFLCCQIIIIWFTCMSIFLKFGNLKFLKLIISKIDFEYF